MSRGASLCLGVTLAAATLLGASPVVAQDKKDAKAGKKAEKPAASRSVAFTWDRARKNLYLSVSFADIVDKKLRTKLRRGLPTTIVFTATLFRAGSKKPLSTTAHTCRITWHVWNELYIIERRSPKGSRTTKTLTLSGVLRRCVRFESRRLSRLLLAGSRQQIPLGVPLVAEMRVRVNPVSSDVLEKIKRWLNRPSSTSVPDPGDALFSTFTGLFRKRIQAAEKEVEFRSKAVLPKVAKAPRKKRRKGGK